MLPSDPQTAWPPRPLARYLSAVAEYDAWWQGDPAKLAAVYGRPGADRPSERSPLTRSGWRFWSRRGTTPDTGETRLHVPVPADVATTSADLLFSEPAGFHVDDPQVAARLDLIRDQSSIDAALTEGAEVAAALSAVWLRVTWDRDVAPDWPILDVHGPDQAVPDVAYGRFVRAVTFWRTVSDDRSGLRVLRHLERHEPGRILHGLYSGTTSTLGHLVPLTDHPDTAGLAGSLTDDPDTAGLGQAIVTGTDRLTAVYVPNMRPSRKFRREGHGRSDYEGVDGLFDALDEAWTSWMRDLRLGRSRIIVPAGALTAATFGGGATFDLDREVWSEVNLPPAKDGASQVTPQQFAIRTEEHRAVVRELLARIVATAGYAGRTFGLHDEGGPATATEVVASERRSFVTRGKKARYWQSALGEILTTLLEVDRSQGFPGSTVPAPVRVILADSVQESPRTVAETIDLLRRAEAATTDTMVRMLHPDWDDVRVAAEVKGVLAESGRQVPDLVQSDQLV